MKIVEMFYSIQGEGKYVGVPQIFIRLPSCNLKCRYCDTKFDEYQEIDDETLFQKIETMLENPVHSISFTGGEPLMHAENIRKVAEKFPNEKIFLETNGTLPRQLEKIINIVDIISMDFKMPSVIDENLFTQHEEFLKLARQKDCYVKIVISAETTFDEFTHALEIISNIDPNILLILQPVDPFRDVKPVKSERLLDFQKHALKYLTDVRIIPQTHKILKLQ